MKHTQTRTDFGVVVGNDTYYCARRSTADRIRRVVRLHKLRGGWCGWLTLSRLVDLARQSRGRHAATIVDTFERIGREDDLVGMRADGVPEHLIRLRHPEI